MNVFLPYQSRWIEDKARVKVWEKSRRVGASYGEAADSALQAAKSREAGGQSTYYLSYNKEMTQQFIKDCGHWARLFNLAAGEMEELVLRDEDKDITVYRIRFASGFDVWGLPSEPRSLRSKQGRVIIDEAAFVENLPELLKAAMALLMWGGSVKIISTQNGDDNPFNELVKDIRSGRKQYSLHCTTLDDALTDGLYRRICDVSGQAWSPEVEAAWREELIADYGDAADEELFCIPAKSGGAYLSGALVEANMHEEIPVFTWQPPPSSQGNFVDWEKEKAKKHTEEWLEEHLAEPLAALALLHGDCSHYLGEDFGRTGDLSILAPATEMRNLSLRLPFLLEMRNCPHRTQEQILFYIIDRLPRFAGASLDARGNGSALAEAARQEYGPENIREVMISEAWYRETMPRLKAALEDKALDLPKDAALLNDLRALRVVRGVARVPDKRSTDKTGHRHGDVAVALAMLYDARHYLAFEEPWDYVGVALPKGVDFTGW